MSPRIRMAPSNRRVLKALRDARGHRQAVTALELFKAGGGMRISARIKDLRDLGFDIEVERVPVPHRLSPNGLRYRYRLVHDAERGW